MVFAGSVQVNTLRIYRFSVANFLIKVGAFYNCYLLAGGSGLHSLTFKYSGQAASHRQTPVCSGSRINLVQGIKNTNTQWKQKEKQVVLKKML